MPQEPYPSRQRCASLPPPCCPRRAGSARHAPSSSGDSAALHPEDEPCHIKDSYNGLCVTDFSVFNEAQHARQRLWHHLDELVAFARRRPGRKSHRGVEVDHLRGEPGRCPNGCESLHARRCDARLLEQLAAGACLRLLSRVEGAGGDFPQGAPGRVAVLPDEQNGGVRPGRVRRARHDPGGARVTDQLELARRAVREADRVHIEPNDPAGMDAAAVELHGIAQRLKSQVMGTLNPSARKYAALRRGLERIGEPGAGEVNGSRPCRVARMRNRSMWNPSETSRTRWLSRAASQCATLEIEDAVLEPAAKATTAFSGKPALVR